MCLVVSKSSGPFNTKKIADRSCTERLWVEQDFKVLKVPMIPKNWKLMEIKVYIQFNLNFFYHNIVLTGVLKRVFLDQQPYLTTAIARLTFLRSDYLCPDKRIIKILTPTWS